MTAAERTQLIENSMVRLNQYYVFPDTAKKMEQAVRGRAARGEYDKITSARELADKLTADFPRGQQGQAPQPPLQHNPIPDRPFNESPSAEEIPQQKPSLRN